MSGKLLLVLFAICLVSAEAFVRRDAPATEKNSFEEIQNQLQALTQSFGEKIKDTFNQDNLQKGFSDVIDNLQKTLNDLKEKTASSADKPKA